MIGAQDVRRWLEDRKAGEVRGRHVEGGPVDARVTWQQAAALIAQVRRFVGWPVLPDTVRIREDAATAETWSRLRAAYRRRA